MNKTKQSKETKQTKQTFMILGIVFLVGSLAALGFGQTALFVTWLPMGIIFFAISFYDVEQ